MVYAYLNNIHKLASVGKVANINLGKNDYKCLEIYVKNIGRNEYELFKQDYSNFKRVVKRLVKVGFLEPGNQSAKKGKYYKLTEAGVLYLVHIRPKLSIELFVNLLQNYSESIVLESFLYPFFEKETLPHIKGTYQLQVLIRYLFDCSNEVLQYVDNLENAKLMGQYLFSWDMLNDNSIRNINESAFYQLKEFLRYKLELAWVEKAEIKLEDSNTIVVFHGTNLLLIRLNDRKDKANLSYKGKILSRFNVASYPDSSGAILPFSVYSPLETKEENASAFFSAMMESIVFSMVTSMLSKPIIGEDVQALSHDTKFLKILSYVKNTLNARFHEIIDTSQIK